MAENILFIGGSLNQTTMMHQIARQLTDYNCYFTPFYTEGFLGRLSKWKLLEFTIAGQRHKRRTIEYLERAGLAIDVGGRDREYDAVVTGTDLYLQPNIAGKRLILVQEGMTEPEGLAYQLVKQLKLPRWMANTAATGLSGAYDAFCVASPGYRDLFIRKGIPANKLFVTGIPNFDNAQIYEENDFPYRNFVLVATSSAREVGKWDNRFEFIRKAREIAHGRQLIFKLHPNEDAKRASREIRSLAPDAQILTDGNVHQMIANCDVLITQNSSVVFTGLALNKEVYSYMDIESLHRIMPIQNNGTSAVRIAQICRALVQAPITERQKAVQKVRGRLEHLPTGPTG